MLIKLFKNTNKGAKQINIKKEQFPVPSQKIILFSLRGIYDVLQKIL